jgi:dTDP-glucose 4,6-dehydratase
MSTVLHHPRIVLVTGGCGFIGSNLVRHLLATWPVLRVVNLDALTYAGNRANLAEIEQLPVARYHFVHGDIADEDLVAQVFDTERPDTVIHLAAESHVDRAIDAPMPFLRTNVLGTAVLLQAARRAWKGRRDVRFHHVSTDEVFGALGDNGAFDEASAYAPNNPYSASKAGADHLVRAWHRTYGLPVTLSNSSNTYGPYQFPEKLIPLIITRALAGQELPLFGDGSQVRDWLHVADHCRALDLIVRQGHTGRTYHVGGGNEWRNRALVELLCDEIQRQHPCPDGYRALIRHVADRPGHDHRYAIDATRLRQELGWAPQHDFVSGIRQTVAWYLAHPQWVAALERRHQATTRRGLADSR